MMGSKHMVDKLKDILDLFCIATGMVINSSKSLIISWGLSEHEKIYLSQTFPFLTSTFKARPQVFGFPPKRKLVLEGRLAMAHRTRLKKG
jgi:hypothetical protein